MAADAPQADLAQESVANAAWRRIDHDWLHSAEALALDINNGINNTSLVLAFELEGIEEGPAVRRRRAARQLEVLDRGKLEGRRQDDHDA